VARALRIEFQDALYHVGARGNERQQIFRDDRDRKQFLILLELSSERYEICLQAFVLLPNHFHLVAGTPRGNLSRWMHWLLVSYTVYFNWRHHRSGHLFQGRYKSFLVESGRGSYLLTLSRYIHLNPVRGVRLGEGTPAERRKRLREFPWSSYPGYAGLRKQWSFVQEKPVLEQIGRSKRQDKIRYRRYVEEGLLQEIESPWERIKWQSALGSESFLRRIQDRMQKEQRDSSEVTALRQSAREPELSVILRKVARHYGVRADRLKERDNYGLEARNVAMWIVWESGSKSLREIGEMFGGISYAAVAQRFRRLEPGVKAIAQKLLNVK
jgi:putative transposase